MNLDQVRIVLVETSHPGNIGATARAMKTMGLSQLWLVNPQHFPDDEATARASGADDVLTAARVCGTLDEALADCTLVLASSARRRELPGLSYAPSEGAAQLLAAAQHAPVALVFGRERNGLHNAELDHCQGQVFIETSSAYVSLNLAAAVQVLCHALRTQALLVAPTPETPPCAPLATHVQRRQLHRHWERLLIGADFLDPTEPRRLMRRLSRLFHRARLEPQEVNILRGIATELGHKLDIPMRQSAWPSPAWSPAVQAHFAQPVGAGAPLPQAQVGEAEHQQPRRRLRLWLCLTESHRIERAGFQAFGGPVLIAVGSWLCQHLPGKTLAEVVALNDRAIMQGLELDPSDVADAVLGQRALEAVLSTFHSDFKEVPSP